MFTHEQGTPKVHHQRAGQGLTAEDKTKRFKAAFDQADREGILEKAISL